MEALLFEAGFSDEMNEVIAWEQRHWSFNFWENRYVASNLKLWSIIIINLFILKWWVKNMTLVWKKASSGYNLQFTILNKQWSIDEN